MKAKQEKIKRAIESEYKPTANILAIVVRIERRFVVL
jgi:hypothetical protein